MFRPNFAWSPAETSYAITHEAVGRLSLVFNGQKWTRGARMKTRRFGHASVFYRDQYLHIMGHLEDTTPGIESWEEKSKTVSRRRRETEWDEGIPNNPKVKLKIFLLSLLNKDFYCQNLGKPSHMQKIHKKS